MSEHRTQQHKAVFLSIYTWQNWQCQYNPCHLRHRNDCFCFSNYLRPKEFLKSYSAKTSLVLTGWKKKLEQIFSMSHYIY